MSGHRRVLLIFALALLCWRGWAEDIEQALARELPRLSDESYRVREEAQQAILALGIRAESAVAAACAKATDPEARNRLAAVLQSYAIEEEQTFALKKIAEDEPFPNGPGKDPLAIEGVSAAQAVKLLSEASGIEMSYYPKDDRLAQLLEQSAPMSLHSSSAANTEHSLSYLLNQTETSFVVDRGKVVIVRMTPAVFFAKLELHLRGRPEGWREEALAGFDGKMVNHWHSVMHFIQGRVDAGGAIRDKWFFLLANRVNDEKESEANRTLGLRALRYFQGKGKAQPDVDEIFIRWAGNLETSPALRRIACRGLSMGTSKDAQEALLALLDNSSLEVQRELLAGLELSLGFAHTTVPALTKAGKIERFNAALAKLAKSTDNDVAIRALALMAQRGDMDAMEALCDRNPGEDWTTQRMMVCALGWLKTRAQAPKKCRVKLDEFARHPSVELRCLYSHVVGQYAGGTGRLPDIEANLKLLDDPEPKVRFFAVNGLSVTYSTNAGVPFRERLGEVRTRLEAMQKTETHPRVLEMLKKGLADMQKE